MSSLTIGRLELAAPAVWQEQTGDPVGTLGGAVVPAPRVPPQYQVTVSTTAADGQTDTQAARLALRRRLRSLLNNTPLKLGAFLYIVFADDPEQDGWYVPGQATLTDLTGAIGLATGYWTAALNPYAAGHRRTHREARQVWMKDLRTGLYARDALGWVYSTDFSALPAVALTVLPNGATSASDSVTGGVLSGAPLPAGRDGGQCSLVQGLTDMTVVGYERAQGALNLSDVIVYDRRGAGDAPSTGPGASWEEVYGPDYPWNWQASGQPADAPVLDNGLVRVRYDATTGDPGLRVDVWNGSAYVEQGKMSAYRYGDTSGWDDTWGSAGLVEWTPERAVMRLILSRSADAYSREVLFVTVQRGQMAAKFDLYPAPKSSGASADAFLEWHPVSTDQNDSVFKSDTQTLPPAQGTGKIVATAGTGSTVFAHGAIGASSFSSSENFLALLRCGTDYKTVTSHQANIAVFQGAAGAEAYSDAAAYGGDTNGVWVQSNGGAGWVSVVLGFSATAGDQVMEAEAIRNTGSGTTSQVADAGASGGECVKDTQTSNAANTLSVTTNLSQAKYRCFVRVKVDSGVTGSFGWGVNSGNTFGSPATTTSTSWTWLDLSDLLPTVANTSFTLDAWASAGTGAVYVDRVELFLVEDRTRSGALWNGARDAGQAALYDARQLGALVAR